MKKSTLQLSKTNDLLRLANWLKLNPPDNINKSNLIELIWIDILFSVNEPAIKKDIK